MNSIDALQQLGIIRRELVLVMSRTKCFRRPTPTKCFATPSTQERHLLLGMYIHIYAATILSGKIKYLPIACVLTLFLTVILSLRAPMTYGQPYVGTVRHYNMPCLRSLSMVWCNKIVSQCSYDVCLFILRMLALLC